MESFSSSRSDSIQHAAEQRRGSFVIDVRAAFGFGNDFVDDSEFASNRAR